MLVESLADIAKLGLYTVCAYVALNAYARHRRPHWVDHLSKRRLAVLALLTLAILAVKVSEDVVAKESGPVDEAILWFVREHVPAGLTGFFGVVTITGSALFLVPVGLAATAAMLIARRRFEALLLTAAMSAALLLSYAVKSIVGRARPDLWESQWYWGSSFPSGHTLNTAAFSTAAALCLARIWPRVSNVAMSVAMVWTGLVAVSRLVLGVHWPSDVFAALCMGVCIPLMISVAYDLRTAATRR